MACRRVTLLLPEVTKRQALHPYFVPQLCVRNRIRSVKQFDVGAYMLGALPGSANFAIRGHDFLWEYLHVCPGTHGWTRATESSVAAYGAVA